MRFRALVIGVIVVATVGLTAGPAAAAEAKAGPESCWTELSTGRTLCVAPDSDLPSAVLEKYGVEIFTEGRDGTAVSMVSSTERAAMARVGVSPLVTYTMAIFYIDANRGGAQWLITSGDASSCTYGQFESSNLGASKPAWDNAISSFETNWGCTGKIWDGASYSGASLGYTVRALTLGSMNDKTTSWIVT